MPNFFRKDENNDQRKEQNSPQEQSGNRRGLRPTLEGATNRPRQGDRDVPGRREGIPFVYAEYRQALETELKNKGTKRSIDQGDVDEFTQWIRTTGPEEGKRTYKEAMDLFPDRAPTILARAADHFIKGGGLSFTSSQASRLMDNPSAYTAIPKKEETITPMAIHRMEADERAAKYAPRLTWALNEVAGERKYTTADGIEAWEWLQQPGNEVFNTGVVNAKDPAQIKAAMERYLIATGEKKQSTNEKPYLSLLPEQRKPAEAGLKALQRAIDESLGSDQRAFLNQGLITEPTIKDGYEFALWLQEHREEYGKDQVIAAAQQYLIEQHYWDRMNQQFPPMQEQSAHESYIRNAELLQYLNTTGYGEFSSVDADLFEQWLLEDEERAAYYRKIAQKLQDQTVSPGTRDLIQKRLAVLAKDYVSQFEPDERTKQQQRTAEIKAMQQLSEPEQANEQQESDIRQGLLLLEQVFRHKDSAIRPDSDVIHAWTEKHTPNAEDAKQLYQYYGDLLRLPNEQFPMESKLKLVKEYAEAMVYNEEPRDAATVVPFSRTPEQKPPEKKRRWFGREL